MDASDRELIVGVCPIADLVAGDIQRRAEFGLAKYGVTLARSDLTNRQWVEHAYQECLDMAVYLRRLMQELD